MTRDYWRGILMVLCVAFLWGGSGAFAKLLAAEGMNQFTVVCYRALFVTVIMGFLLYVREGRALFRLSPRMCVIYTLLGVSVMGNITGYMMACVYLSVSQALMILYTFPIVTMAGSSIVTGERPNMIQVLSAFAVILGLYVGFVMGSDSGGPISSMGVAWSLLSVFTLAGQALISRRISKAEISNPLIQLFYAHLFGGFVLIIAKSLFFGWADLAFITKKGFLLMQYPAFVSALLGYGLLFTALKYIPAPLASLLCTLEIVVAILLSPILLNVIPPINEIIGSAIIVVAIACSVVKS